jgi:hypothetical protein
VGYPGFKVTFILIELALMKIMIKPLLVGAASTLILGLGAAPSQAVVLIGNLSSPTYINGRGFDNAGDVVAASFIIPSGSTPYRLDSATLIINYLVDGSTPRLTLRSATNGTANNSNPGTILSTFTNPVFNTSDPASNPYTFTNSGFILQPGTPYFLTLDQDPTVTQPGGNLWNWRQGGIPGSPATSVPVNPTGIALTFGSTGYRFSQDGGAFGANGDVRNSYVINATAVPLESDALPILVSLSLFGAGIVVKRKLANKGKIEIDS